MQAPTKPGPTTTHTPNHPHTSRTHKTTYQENDAIGVSAQVGRCIKDIITKRPGHTAHPPHQTHGKIMRVQAYVLPLPHIRCNVVMMVVVVMVVVVGWVAFRVPFALPAGRGSIGGCGYKLEAVVGHHSRGAGRGGA